MRIEFLIISAVLFFGYTIVIPDSYKSGYVENCDSDIKIYEKFTIPTDEVVLSQNGEWGITDEDED